MSAPYASRKEVAKSYRPRSYVMSPGLLRARAPFRLQNAITGLVLFGFSAAVWAYSISAVKQDDFSDVDEEAKEMMMMSTTTRGRPGVEVVGAGADGDRSGSGSGGAVDAPMELDSGRVGSGSGSERGMVGAVKPRGVLAPLLDRTFPSLLDPTRKTLVWGAPSLDDPGRVRLRSSGLGERR